MVAIMVGKAINAYALSKMLRTTLRVPTAPKVMVRTRIILYMNWYFAPKIKLKHLAP